MPLLRQLCLATPLAILTIAPALRAQDPLTVTLAEPVDSAKPNPNNQYRARVTRATAIQGVQFPQNSTAVLLLQGAPGKWTMALAGAILDGKGFTFRGLNPNVVRATGEPFNTLAKQIVATPERMFIPAGIALTFTIAGDIRPLEAKAAPSAPPPTPAKLAGPPPDPGTQIGDPNAVFRALNYEVALIGCARQGTAATTCDFTVKNLGEDREIGIGPRNGFGVVDSKGQLVGHNKTIFAGGSRNWTLTISGITAKARLVYNGVDPDIASLARVPLNMGTAPGASGGGSASFEWRNVPLGGAPAAAPSIVSANDPTVSEAEGWRFTLQRCTPAPRDAQNMLVECFIKVENLKGDRDLILDGAVMIDMEGRQVGNRWYKQDSLSRGVGFIGDAAAYAKSPLVRTVEYDKLQYVFPEPVISNATPFYAYAVFSDADPSVKKLAALRYSMRTKGTGGGLYGQITASWKNIELTPPPKAPPLAPAPRK